MDLLWFCLNEKRSLFRGPLVREEGVEPSRHCYQWILLTTIAFATLTVCSLDYSFTILDFSKLGG